MSVNKIILNSTSFGRFYFYFSLDIVLAETHAFLEVTLESKADLDKKNIFKYEFTSPGSRKIDDKISMVGLVDGPYTLGLCLFDAKGENILSSSFFPLELVLERDSMMDYLYDYELCGLSISERDGIGCTAKIKNLGNLNWQDNSNVQLFFKFEIAGKEPILVDAKQSVSVPSGELVDVFVPKQQFSAPQGIYKLTLELRLQDSILPISKSKLEDLLTYLSGGCNPDGAAIRIDEHNLKLGKFISIKGTVKNNGLTDWYLGPEVCNPYLLGLKVFDVSKKGEEFIGEYRFCPNDYWCNSGQQFEFSSTYEIKKALNGQVKVVVAMVREYAYWFRGLKDSDVEIFLEDDSRLESDHVPIDNLAEHRLFSSGNKPVETVLIVSPSLPLFDREAGGLRMFEILKKLKSEINNVVYFYEHTGIEGDPDTYINALLDIGVICKNNLAEIFFSKDMQPDVVILVTWGCAERFFGDVREIYPSAVVVVDSIDIQWKREKGAIDAGLLDMTLEEWQERKDREKSAYRNSDVVWVVTENDRISLEKECPNIRTMVVSIIHDLRHVNFTRKTLENRKALFVGQFRHAPNVSAGIEAVNIILEYNRSRLDKISIDLIGDNAPDEIKKLHDGKYVFVRGHVADLTPFEENASFMLAPLIYGAGVKGKVCEAISAGLPIITTDIGNEGINLVHRKDVFIAPDRSSALSGIDFIFEDSLRAAEMVKGSREKLKQFFSRESVAPILENFIDYRPITIAIVTYNKKLLLQRCLSTLFELTKYPNFKVVVLSNACTDGTDEILESYSKDEPERFRYIKSNINDYFVRPNNRIIKECYPEDVVLLNNDVEILDPLWLHELNFAAYMSPWVGAAGCMSIDENGRILEAGARMDSQGNGANLGRGDSPDNPTFNSLRYVDYVSGCCLYMKRSSIDLVGVFDEDFHPMYYEDAAWQFLLKIKGYSTVYTPRTRILHKEGSSAGTDLGRGMKRYQNINREKFKLKFGQY